MKKYVLWPLLAAIGGVGAFLLRLLQRSTGFEVDTGLPIPGNLYAILLVAWFVVLAAVCLLAARPLLPADREDPPLFPTGFSVASPGLLTPAVMGLFLLTASGVLDLLFGFSGASALTGSGETVTVFVTAQGSQLFSGREHLVVGLLSLLSAASLLPAVPACRIRPEGGARKPFQSPLLLVPVCCLVVRLVLTYRVVSVDPSLTDYYTELLAVVCGGVAFYCALQNLGTAAAALRWLLGILSPFLLGGALAFVLNVPMRAIERHLYPYSRRGAKFRRPLALVLTLLAVLGVLTLASSVIGPGIADAVMTIVRQIPSALDRLREQLEALAAYLPLLEQTLTDLELSIPWDDWYAAAVNFAKNFGSGLVSSGSGFYRGRPDRYLYPGRNDLDRLVDVCRAERTKRDGYQRPSAGIG